MWTGGVALRAIAVTERERLDRLPAVENGFDDVGSEEGERQDAADLGFMQAVHG